MRYNTNDLINQAAEDLAYELEINSFKLIKAIKNEDYESAVTYRDTIEKAIKQGSLIIGSISNQTPSELNKRFLKASQIIFNEIEENYENLIDSGYDKEI